MTDTKTPALSSGGANFVIDFDDRKEKTHCFHEPLDDQWLQENEREREREREREVQLFISTG